jgi:hypothetical protein
MPTGAESSAIFFDYRAVRAEVKALTEDFSDGPHQVYENLKEMLEQAELTGDKQLARAVYHRAIDVGASEVIERFIASRPREVHRKQAKGQGRIQELRRGHARGAAGVRV